jgi:hypothetical protein
VLLLAVSVVAGTAAGGERMHPWSGGAGKVTPPERALSGVAQMLAGGGATVRCASPSEWHVLAARNDFDASVTWAMTPLRHDPSALTSRPEGYTALAPRTCRLLAAFAAAPAETAIRTCRHEAGDGRRRVLGECDDWGAILIAVHVVGHESVHLVGIVDEAVADCLAMQVDALVAMRLGADAKFARTLARDYWTQYYRAQAPAYRSAGCRNGGRFDVFRSDDAWPTPNRYPAPIDRILASVAGQALSSEPLRPSGHSFG